MKPIQLGIIGCGVISNSHLDLIKECPGAEAIAVADIQEERAKAIAEKYSIPSFYTSENDLLKDERIDGVILAMPTGVRTPIAC